MTTLVLHFDGFRLGRGQNDRGKSWQARWAKGTKRERARVATELWLRFLQRSAPGSEPTAFRREVGAGPWRITLTRIAPSGGLDEHDNLRGSFKATADELSQWLGVNDGGGQVEWQYTQERGDWGVRVRIESLAAESAA
jgi:hypothetical protein